MLLGSAIAYLLLATIVHGNDQTRQSFDNIDEDFDDGGSKPPVEAIINGQQAIPHEFPWMVSIQKADDHKCGGVLISSRIILTAAHCFYHRNGEPFGIESLTVLLGVHDLSNITNFALQTGVKRVIVHPFYRHDNRNGDFDIALIELPMSTACLNSPNIGLATLASKDQEFRQIMEKRHFLKSAGWGIITKNAKTSADVLMKADIQPISYKQCQNRYSREHFNVTSFVICTDSSDTDICQGDSGGPLFYKEAGRAVVVGIVSRSSNGCGRKNSASIFSRVSKYREDFIDKEMSQIQKDSQRPTCSADMPWVAAMYVSNNHVCIGAVIAPSVIITSASCLANNPSKASLSPEDIEIRFATPDIGWSLAGNRFRGQKTETHRFYRKDQLNRDFDLSIVFAKDSPSRVKTGLMKLPPADQQFTQLQDRLVTVVGWNLAQSSLVKVQATVLPYSKCKPVAEGVALKVTSFTFCVETRNSDACQINSGGPVIFEDATKNNMLVGVVSWTPSNLGSRCESDGTYTLIVSRISKFMDDFIFKKI